jgi:F0F1-type ATP synthase assembly protein I
MGRTSFARLVKKDMPRILFYQFLIIVGFTLFIYLLKGTQSSLSALAGALAYWLPTLLFIWGVSAKAHVRSGAYFLVSFLFGEGLKLLLCGMLFVICIKYCQVNIMNAVIGLIGAMAAFWVASASLIAKSETGASS